MTTRGGEFMKAGRGEKDHALAKPYKEGKHRKTDTRVERLTLKTTKGGEFMKAELEGKKPSIAKITKGGKFMKAELKGKEPPVAKATRSGKFMQAEHRRRQLSIAKTTRGGKFMKMAPRGRGSIRPKVPKSRKIKLFHSYAVHNKLTKPNLKDLQPGSEEILLSSGPEVGAGAGAEEEGTPQGPGQDPGQEL